MDHRGIQILEEIIGSLHPGSTKPAPIKRYSCMVNGVACRGGTLDEVKRRIDEVLGPIKGPHRNPHNLEGKNVE